MHHFRLPLFLLVCFICCGRISPAQNSDTNLLTVCTEADLIQAFEVGGDYFMDCGTNIVLIQLTEPLVTSKRVSIFTTNQVVLTGSNVTRLMVIQPEGEVTMGGFSFFSGRQTVTNENHGGIEDTAGGAIYVDRGALFLYGGRFENNSAVGITGTAGEAGSGENGEHGGDAAGGAIYNNFGIVNVSNVVFVSNSTTAGAGGNGGSGRTSGFGTEGGNGGNGGSAGGSAIYSNGGDLAVIACTFTNNIATGAAAGVGGQAGGLLGAPGLPGESGDGVGAAIAGADAKLSIFGSTFVNNRVTGANGQNGTSSIGRNEGNPGLVGGDAAGGAIYSAGTIGGTNLWMTNSTFFRNSATSGRGGNGGTGSADGFGFDGGEGGDGGLASGGAIDSQTRAWIVHCTFSDNTVSAGAGGNGGAGGGSLGEEGDSGSEGGELGAAIYGSSVGDDQINLVNSIVANSTPSISGQVDDRGGNITTDMNPKLDSPLSFPATNAFLRPLANNGGPTPTMAIRTNSPAVDNGVVEFCVSVDQRGSNRLARCDIGAFELPLPTIPPEVVGTNSFTLTRTTNQIITLRWPGGYTNLSLQVATNLLLTNTLWRHVTNDIVTTTNGNSLTNSFTITPNTALPQAFYRLFGLSGHGSGGGIPPLPELPPFPTNQTSGVIRSGLNAVEKSRGGNVPIPPLP